MKTLRVCLSEELPAEVDRSPDYLYFAYDKLYLFSGQNYLEDNFAIVDEIPEEQVYGLIYILNTDGSVHRLIDYEDVKIAEIEDPDQIEILQKAGTMFYVNARHRYIDSQRRVLTLPFNDGTYEMNVSTQKDTIYDENTILKYNPETEQFEVYGDKAEDFIDFSKPFRGATTSTAVVNVNGPRVSANVRISSQEQNLLRISGDGLYIPMGNFVSKATFNEWTSDVFDIKTTCEELLRKAGKDIEKIEELVTPEYIQATIMSLLVERFPDIQTAIDNYDDYVAALDGIENEVMNYAAIAILEAREAIFQRIANFKKVEDLDNAAEYYTNEVDYYHKAEEWIYPKITFKTKQIIMAAVLAVMNDTEG